MISGLNPVSYNTQDDTPNTSISTAILYQHLSLRSRPLHPYLMAKSLFPIHFKTTVYIFYTLFGGVYSLPVMLLDWTSKQGHVSMCKLCKPHKNLTIFGTGTHNPLPHPAAWEQSTWCLKTLNRCPEHLCFLSLGPLICLPWFLRPSPPDMSAWNCGTFRVTFLPRSMIRPLNFVCDSAQAPLKTHYFKST